MTKPRFGNIIICLAIFLISELVPLASQSITLREQANERFGFITWFSGGNQELHVSKIAQTIPGGNETFPVLSVSDKPAILSAIYPSLPKIGTLDYSGMDETLISCAKNLTMNISESTIPDSVCEPGKRFISAVLTFRLARYTGIHQVYFSRPNVIDPDQAEVHFRFIYGAEKNDEGYLTVIAVRKNNSWFLDDFWFGDGH